MPVGQPMDKEKMLKPHKSQEDYYFNNDGLMVFTEKYLLKRGYCCKNGCRHCPYPKDKA
jgi:hypothetical protein